MCVFLKYFETDNRQLGERRPQGLTPFWAGWPFCCGLIQVRDRIVAPLWGPRFNGCTTSNTCDEPNNKPIYEEMLSYFSFPTCGNAIYLNSFGFVSPSNQNMLQDISRLYNTITHMGSRLPGFRGRLGTQLRSSVKKGSEVRKFLRLMNHQTECKLINKRFSSQQLVARQPHHGVCVCVFDGVCAKHEQRFRGKRLLNDPVVVFLLFHKKKNKYVYRVHFFYFLHPNPSHNKADNHCPLG